MKQRQLMQGILVAAALCLGLGWSAWAAQPCGVNVTQRGKVITVTRTGTNDTTNLQCALDLAVKAGRRDRLISDLLIAPCFLASKVKYPRKWVNSILGVPRPADYVSS